MKMVLKYIAGLFFSLLLLSSCGTQRNVSGAIYDPVEVEELSLKLNIPLSNLDKDDDRMMPLYAETSLWLGIPYRYGGTTKRGVDCSGFIHVVYNKVYGMSLPRTTSDLGRAKYKKVGRNKLKSGDLVFFATSKNKKKITHVGIYLKEGYFIHASTKRGVVVDHINDAYYKKRWIKGARIL